MARDTSTLRDILFDELDGLRNGTSDPKRAQAVAKLSSQIIGTAKVELEYHRAVMKARAQGEAFVLGSMDLGRRVSSAEEPSHHKQVEHRAPPTPANNEPENL